MIGGDAGTARHIPGGGIGMPETGRNEDSSGWSGLFGHSSRPARRIPRGPEAEIVWKVAFRGHTLTDGKPYGECRVSEAVVHTTGKRKVGAEERYHKLLKGAFQEAFRVLKPGGKMSVVFGNSSGRIWGLVQRALREAGFGSEPVHVAILDKGQRSVKGLNSGSEGVVTVDLIMTVEKPDEAQPERTARELTNGDARQLIEASIKELPENVARNPSHLYGRILSKAIQNQIVLDDLHLGDVLIALRNAGYTIERKSGLLSL